VGGVGARVNKDGVAIPKVEEGATIDRVIRLTL